MSWQAAFVSQASLWRPSLVQLLRMHVNAEFPLWHSVDPFRLLVFNAPTIIPPTIVSKHIQSWSRNDSRMALPLLPNDLIAPEEECTLTLPVAMNTMAINLTNCSPANRSSVYYLFCTQASNAWMGTKECESGRAPLVKMSSDRHDFTMQPRAYT